MFISVQACPKCQSIIEKDGGCNHVECYRCKHEFCWMCLSNCKASHSMRCSRYEENPDLAKESSQARAEELLKKYLHYFRRVGTYFDIWYVFRFITTPNKLSGITTAKVYDWRSRLFNGSAVTFSAKSILAQRVLGSTGNIWWMPLTCLRDADTLWNILILSLTTWMLGHAKHW